MNFNSKKGRQVMIKPKTRNPSKSEKKPTISSAKKEKPKQPRGRPVAHKDEWTKVTVVLLDKQIHWLDKLALEIRLNTKAAISRAEILRGMISAIKESRLDLSQATSEEEIKKSLLEKLKK
jgi:hypothetical protein